MQKIQTDEDVLKARFDPQILFSMFDDPAEQEKYIQFIFPNKLELEPVEKKKPRFHSYLSTDVKGNQSFFHCFLFYEP